MKVIEKLKKLINHAESARNIGNVAEAEAFAGKIQELLDNHNLSISDIDLLESSSSVNMSTSKEFTSISHWEMNFITRLAMLNGCRILKSGRGIYIVGTEDDRQILSEIFRYFSKLARILAEAKLKEFKLTSEYKRKRKKIFHSKQFKSAFLHGFIVALNQRLTEKHELAKVQSNNSKALIFIGNKLSESDKWIKENISVKQISVKSIQHSIYRNDAFRQGIDAGKSVALTTKTID